MNPFYTRTGDDGTTGLLGEGRVPKSHPRTEAVGTVDEATAALGLARALCQTQETAELLLKIQRDLYALMAEIAATPPSAARFRAIDSQSVAWLEAQTDRLAPQVNMPSEFILPGDSAAGAALSLARTVVRRAERRVVQLVHDQELDNRELMRYLNRLSSLCFVLELWENQAAGAANPTLAKETPPSPQSQ
jgi:cob(I)alamin adenosyltransferase